MTEGLPITSKLSCITQRGKPCFPASDPQFVLGREVSRRFVKASHHDFDFVATHREDTTSACQAEAAAGIRSRGTGTRFERFRGPDGKRRKRRPARLAAISAMADADPERLTGYPIGNTTADTAAGSEGQRNLVLHGDSSCARKSGTPSTRRDAVTLSSVPRPGRRHSPGVRQRPPWLPPQRSTPPRQL